MRFWTKAKKVSGKKKGIKRFYLPNSLSFNAARAPTDRGDLMIMKNLTRHSSVCHLVVMDAPAELATLHRIKLNYHLNARNGVKMANKNVKKVVSAIVSHG